jgi:hypothetical protein
MTKKAVTIQVPSEDPEKKERKDEVKPDAPDKDKDKEGEDLVGVSSRILHSHFAQRIFLTKSEEDLQLKNELEMLVERLRVREFAVELLNSLSNFVLLHRNRIRRCIALLLKHCER